MEEKSKKFETRDEFVPISQLPSDQRVPLQTWYALNVGPLAAIATPNDELEVAIETEYYNIWYNYWTEEGDEIAVEE